jgi:hypothetical protein
LTQKVAKLLQGPLWLCRHEDRRRLEDDELVAELPHDLQLM